MKPAICSIYYRNIPVDVRNCQRQIVNHYNVSRIPFYQYEVYRRVGHDGGMEQFIQFCALDQLHYDVILFLDIDCVPLSPLAIDYYLRRAQEGVLVGNAQRACHLENAEHVYVGPNGLAFSLETWRRIGRPRMIPTSRGDVAEEFTYQAETHRVPIELIYPSGCDEKGDGSWNLGAGKPVFGYGTTYTHPTLGELFWHAFQVRTLEQQARFTRKCEEIRKSWSVGVQEIGSVRLMSLPASTPSMVP